MFLLSYLKLIDVRQKRIHMQTQTHANANFLLKNISFLKKLVLKIFCGCCFPPKIFYRRNNSLLAIIVCGSKGHGTMSDEHKVETKVRIARTTNGRVTKGELLS